MPFVLLDKLGPVGEVPILSLPPFVSPDPLTPPTSIPPGRRNLILLFAPTGAFGLGGQPNPKTKEL